MNMSFSNKMKFPNNRAAKKNIEKRCAIDLVYDVCPLTCKRCDSCWDYSRKFRYVNSNGDLVEGRCFDLYYNSEPCVEVEGVSEMCRNSCDICQPTDDFFLFK